MNQPTATYFLANRAKDTAEDVDTWVASILPMLQVPGWNIRLVSGKDVVEDFRTSSGRPDWKGYAEHVPSLIPPLCQVPRYVGFIIPLAGPGGPTVRTPFVGKWTAQLMETVGHQTNLGVQRHNFAAELLEDNSFRLHPITGISMTKSGRSAQRWGTLVLGQR